MSLQRAIFALIALALVAGLLPAALVLDRRLSAELEDRARRELALAPPVLADRESMRADAMMMHAKDLAGSAELARAVQQRDSAAAKRLASDMAAPFGEQALLVIGDGEAWLGPHPGEPLVRATRDGGMPVALLVNDDTLRRIALAPVRRDGVWLGAAGVSVLLDRSAAGTLAGLTRSEVVILLEGGLVAASTADEETTAAIAGAAVDWPGDDDQVRELKTAPEKRYLVALGALGDAARVAFARDVSAELAVLPQLRRVAMFAGLSALVLALISGAICAALMARPVRSLARAADRLAAGDFGVPVSRSSIREVDRVGRAFDEMRRALAARLADLEAANRELAERQRRLSALQAELIQRDRLAASGRLVTELAHEVRNPVANVRNCLEVISRRVGDDLVARRFADLAIDELLRMHELAERMLDINRPRDPERGDCDAAAIVREVVALVRAGASHGPLEVEADGVETARALIPPDALKQVLLNVVQNAREATDDRGRIELSVAKRDAQVLIEIEDDGPGIPEDVLPRVFDPFFTTKGSVQGVGLGLFVAEGIARGHGGRLSAVNREGRGARFRIELRSAERSDGSGAGPGVEGNTGDGDERE